MNWIDITKELPAFDDHVILNTKGGVTTGKLVKIDRQGQHFSFNETNDIYWDNQTVCHWMPLPKPPTL